MSSPRPEMKFVRLNLQDSNCTIRNRSYTWDLPLSLDHRRVGLSSFAVKLKNTPLPKDTLYLSITSNLVDKNMANQTGCLALIPFDHNDKLTYTHSSSLIGKFFPYVNNSHYKFLRNVGYKPDSNRFCGDHSQYFCSFY